MVVEAAANWSMTNSVSQQVPTISGYLARFGRGIPAFAQVNRYP